VCHVLVTEDELQVQATGGHPIVYRHGSLVEAVDYTSKLHQIFWCMFLVAIARSSADGVRIYFVVSKYVSKNLIHMTIAYAPLL